MTTAQALAEWIPAWADQPQGNNMYSLEITLYAHISREDACDAAVKAGLTGEALRLASYLGTEHKMEYRVNPETGDGILVAVDGHPLPLR